MLKIVIMTRFFESRGEESIAGSELGPENRVVLTTAPFGDTVAMSAVVKGLEQKNIPAVLSVPEGRLSLAEHMRVSVAPQGAALENTVSVEMGDYLNNDVHFRPLPDRRFKAAGDIPRLNQAGQELGHLSQWMAVQIAEKLKIEPFPVDPAEAKIFLTAEQLLVGQKLLCEQVGTDKPVVLIAPDAGSPNRVIPPALIRQIMERLGRDIEVALLEPLPKPELIAGFDKIEVAHVKSSLAEWPAVLAAAKAVVTADSGSFHVAAAVRQGSAGEAQKAGLRLHPEQVILVAGSSNPLALIYRGNQYVVPPKNVCEVIPCGRHGYDQEKPNRLQSLPLHMIEKSACIWDDYPKTGLARCMAAVSPDEIVAKVRQAI